MHRNDSFQRRLIRYPIAIAVIVILLITIITVFGYISGAPWVGMVEYTYNDAGSVTSIDGYKTFWDWLSLLIVPLVLAIGGSLLVVFVTHELDARRDRTAWSMRIAEDYLHRFEEHGRVKKYLLASETGISSSQELNIRAWGNWLEFVALLCNREMADIRLVQDLGIDRFIIEFYDDAKDLTIFKMTWKDDWQNIVKFVQIQEGNNE